MFGIAVTATVLTVLSGAAGCQRHVERDANGEVSSVGVKTDPEVTQEVRKAGEATAEAGRAAGEDIKQGTEQAANAVAEGTERAAAATEETAAKASAAIKENSQEAKRAADDASVTAKVKTMLLADPEVKALAITVDTVNGEVTLTGTAETAYQKQEAGKLARHTEGVKSVVNKIEVTGKG